MDLATINNQFDNQIRHIPLNESVFKKIVGLVKEPLLVTSKDKIPQWKFCTVLGEKRCTESIGDTNILILDFDDSDYSYAEFEKEFQEYKYILHTSYSYDGTNSKFRVLLFLDQEYSINKLFFKCHERLFSPYHILLNRFKHVDPASFVRAQFFKMPAKKEKTSPYYYSIHNGRPFSMFEIEGFTWAFDQCEAKQKEYLRNLEIELSKNRNPDNDLTRAKEYIDKKLENTPAGNRHMTIFGLACWWKKLGGSYSEFKSIMPSWADRAYQKQITRLAHEWSKLR